MPGRRHDRSIPFLDRTRQRHPQSRCRLALVLLALIAYAQTADFKAETKLARIEVRAVDAQFKPLLNLTPTDFAITENGQLRTVTSLSIDELPLDLFLIIDVSGSMHANITRVAQHANQALHALKPQDRVALMSFNFNHKLRLPLTSNHAEIEAAINELTQKKNFGGGTRINTPIYEAAKLLRQQSPPQSRRAILVLTDGQGLKGTSSGKVLNELWEGDITLNALLMPLARYAKALRVYRKATTPHAFLTDASISDLVNKSSGELMNASESTQPLVEILQRIRSRYTLYYQPLESSPDEQGKARNVTATLSLEGKARHPNAKPSGRRQYSAP